MKTLIRIAVGAAIAGALVNLLRKQRERAGGQEDRMFDDSVGVGSNAYESGQQSGQQMGQQSGSESGEPGQQWGAIGQQAGQQAGQQSGQQWGQPSGTQSGQQSGQMGQAGGSGPSGSDRETTSREPIH